MKKFSDAIWTAVFAIVFILLYFFVPALHSENTLYGFYILVGATLAFFSAAIKRKK